MSTAHKLELEPGVSLTPVAWLAKDEFAEVNKRTDGGLDLFVSDAVNVETPANRSRLMRLLSNFNGRVTIGDESMEMSFQ